MDKNHGYTIAEDVFFFRWPYPKWTKINYFTIAKGFFLGCLIQNVHKSWIILPLLKDFF